MRLPRIRFTIRSLIIAVALVGLNLAGGIATSKHYPRGLYSPGVGIIESYGGSAHYQGKEGLGFDYRHFFAPKGRRLVSVTRGPLPPTIPRIWSPVVASASITLLVLLFLLRRPRLQHRFIHSNDEGAPLTQCPRVWIAVRWITAVLALIGLNVAGAVSRPPADRSELRLDYPTLFGGTPTSIIISFDGSMIERRLVDGSDLPLFQFSSDGSRVRGDVHRIREGTIDYGTDGSIVAYEGRPGEKLSRPYVIRPPIRSFLEMWWPVMASAAITVLVLALLGCQVRGQMTNPSDAVATRS